MRAEVWMTREVETCRPETSLSQAAHRMWQASCGILPVVDDAGKVVGIITDRDICMGAHLRNRVLADVQVADSMSRQVVACHAREPIEVVLQRMSEARVRRVPMLDDGERPVGILSLDDLACRLVELSERERARLLPRFVETLAAIGETRACRVAPAPPPAPSATASPVAAG